jgi:hypothetical protein
MRMNRRPVYRISGAILLAVVMLAGFAWTGSGQIATVEAQGGAITYPIVDTDQTYCFDATGVIPCGESFNGQDAQYAGLQPAYQDNGDGTITDLNTGLMWIQDAGEKTTYAAAMAELETYTFAGYDDWRLPTIKELYSLTQFSGIDPSVNGSSSDAEGLVPFIDSDTFAFLYGDESGGARIIDAQWLTSTVYDSTVMNNQRCFFGFNFADGRIKCYPLQNPGGSGGYFAQYVRGGSDYGVNAFADNGDGTITDAATGLTWMQNDNGAGVEFAEALDYCESLTLAGYDDWRLSNIKELQSIVDYDRSPDVTGSAALDPIFSISSMTNEAGQVDYPFFWSSTTHIGYVNTGGNAAYISFGRAMGYMEQFGGWVDVHGAGAQRSDPKAASSTGSHGPQGDAVRSANYVRCVRGGVAAPASGDDPATSSFPDAGGMFAGAPTADGPPNQQGQPPQQDQAGGPGGQPPQEAIDACAGSAGGAACTIQTPNGALSGTCQSLQNQLACVPNQ